MERGVYTFMVEDKASEAEIKKAVKEIYKVMPERVNIINFPRKKVFQKGKSGMRGGGRKAMVYLKEGDKIEFV